MTPRELVIKTLNHEPVTRVARDLWLPACEESIPAEELAELNVRYPSDIVQADVPPPHAKKASSKPSKGGDPTGYQPPMELLDKTRFAKVNKSCLATNRFVLAWSEVRPFDRLRALRGSEAALADLARGTKEARGLLAGLHAFNCKEIELWAETEVDGVALRDDWGSAEGLLIDPEMWRELFRPLYRDYCKILHDKDKFVFFHSDGQIGDIFGDLIKVGMDAIHAQLHLMDAGRLTKRFRGRVTFWGGQDPKLLSEPGPIDDFRKAVQTVRKALDFGRGGVIAQCQWEPAVRVQTMATFFEQWLAPLTMHG